MSPTGPYFPTAAADGGGPGGVWSNPTNAEVDDGVYASGDISMGGEQTNYLQTTGYNFNLPPTAIIDGIYVEFEATGTNAATLGLSIMKGGVTAGTSKVGVEGWPASETWFGYGGSTDLWGATWLYSDINNSGFGAAVSAYNTHGGGTALIDAVRITVYWHTAPTPTPKRYVYKVYSNSGQYLGNLPKVTTDFGYSLDINTAGTSITVTCAVSPDTSITTPPAYITESGAPYITESGAPYITENTAPAVAIGTSTADVLIKNGNRVQVWEYGYYNPNGKCMFLGQIERWEASFGGQGGGSGGAATSNVGDDSITMLIYSDGQDLDNFMVRGAPYTYTTDVSQTSQNNNSAITVSGDKGAGSNTLYGQTWLVGAGVTNLGAFTVKLKGKATVTITIYDSPVTLNVLGSATQAVNVSVATDIQFAFPLPIVTTPGQSYFAGVSVNAGQSISIYYSNASVYANGQRYELNYTATWSTGWAGDPIRDLYFKTFSGTGTTTGIYTSEDPTTGILIPLLQDYQSRGGIIQYTGTSIVATGLSVTYQFNTNTTYEGLQAVLSVSPDGFYYFVDPGTDILYFQPANTEPDIILTKDLHFDQITIIATIENIFNQTFFSGGVVSGSSIYVTASDAASIALYGHTAGQAKRQWRPRQSNGLNCGRSRRC